MPSSLFRGKIGVGCETLVQARSSTYCRIALARRWI